VSTEQQNVKRLRAAFIFSQATEISVCKATPATLEARERMTKALDSFFKGAKAKIIERLTKRVKARKALSKASDDPNDYTEIDWSLLPPQIREALQTAAQEGVALGFAQLGIDDDNMITESNDQAAAWAEDRAAELVGMKWVNGELIQNPTAKWRIDDTTREQLNAIVKEAFEKETRMADLAQEIEDAGTFAPWRADMIATTETARAQGNGNLESWNRSGVVEQVGWKTSFDHAVEDECDDLEDGSPYALGEVPEYPAHPRCVSGDTLIASCDRITLYFKRWFEGEVVDITTLDGDKLTVTPNHPMLTKSGWMAANEIAHGTQLLKCRTEDAISALVHDPKHKLTPSVIEQVVSSLLESSGVSAARMPASPEDFHSDFSKADDEVSVIWADSDLSLERDAVLPQELSEATFENSESIDSLDSASAVAHLLKVGTDAAESCVRIPSSSKPFLGTLTGSSEPSSIALASDGESVTSEPVVDAARADSDDPSEINRRLSGFISFIEVVNIERRKFAGHVYNLQNESGYYFANNLIVHNCECGLVIVKVKEAESAA
jgi:hypothetical protein